MNTLLLDTDTWDLLADASGNIAMASPPYALAQDVSSACKLFRSELYYATQKGVLYFEDILGKAPPLQLLKQSYVDAALTVPGVVAAVCFITSVTARKVSGQVQATDTAGAISSAGF